MVVLVSSLKQPKNKFLGLNSLGPGKTWFYRIPFNIYDPFRNVGLCAELSESNQRTQMKKFSRD